MAKIPQEEPHEFAPQSPGNYSRDIALLHQTQVSHDRQIQELFQQSVRTQEMIREESAKNARGFDSLRDSFTASRQTNWQQLTAFFGAVVILIGGGWTIVKMNTEGTVSPIVSQLQLVQQSGKSLADTVQKISDIQQITRSELAANSAGDSASRDDRAHLNSSLDKLAALCAENEATMREHNATTREKLTEIETQFRSEDEARNIQWADMRRTMALIWEQAFGTRYPSDISYYPHIGQTVTPANSGK